MRSQYMFAFGQLILSLCFVSFATSAALPGALVAQDKYCGGSDRILPVQDLKGNRYAVCCKSWMPYTGYDSVLGANCRAESGQEYLPTPPKKCPSRSEKLKVDGVHLCFYPDGQTTAARDAPIVSDADRLAARAGRCKGNEHMLEVLNQTGAGYSMCCKADMRSTGYDWNKGAYCVGKGGQKVLPTPPVSCPKCSKKETVDGVHVCFYGPNGVIDC